MKITDALLGEHAIFYLLFDELERLVGNDAPLEVQRALARTIGHALLSHAKLENELLFPALGDIPPVQVMRREHDSIDALFMRLGDEAPAVFAAAVSHVLDFTRDHFHKEEAVLFPFADRNLEATAQDELARRWGELRGVTTG